MWQGTWSSQQATTCSAYAATTRQQKPSSHRSTQRCRSTVISCGRQGQHDAIELGLPRAHQHVHTAATATVAAAPASICQEAQHRQQQFQSSSGMQSSMLRLQQQQATQLLHAVHAQGSPTVLELQQHRHERVQLVDEHARSDVNRTAAPQLSFGRDKLRDSDDDGQVDMQQRQQHEVSRQQLPVECPSQHQQQSSHPQQQMQQQQESPQMQQHRQRQQQQKSRHQRKALGQQGVQQQHPLRQSHHRLLSHPAQFTGWIKHCSSLKELQQLHNRYGDKFNSINLSAMLVRLARLYGNTGCDRGGQHSDSTKSDTYQHAAQQLALQLAEQLQQQLSDCDSARQAANGMWALASLQCTVPDNLLQQAAQQLVAKYGQMLRGSQPQELATIAWGFGKLHHDPCCTLWPHILAAAQHQQHFDRYKPQEVVMLLWAYANRQQQQQETWRSESTVGQRQARLQQQLDADALSMQQQLQERRSSNSAASTSATKFGGFEPSSRGRHRGCSDSGKLDEDTVSNGSSSHRHQVPTVQQGLQMLLPCLSATIQRQLQQMTQSYKPREVSMLLWSLAVLDYREHPLLQALAHHLQPQIRQGRANAQDISTSLWGVGKLQLGHCGLITTAAEAHNSWLCHCSTQDLALALYGAAACARAAAATVPWQHVYKLWQHGVPEVQSRIAVGHDVGPAEVATLLQSCQLLLQHGVPECGPPQQQQQQQKQWHHNSPSSVDSLSIEGSISSMSSVDAAERDGAENAVRAARSLLLVLHDYMLHHPSFVAELGCKHLVCILHSLAGIEQADCRPAPELLSFLMAAAQSVAAGMNRQQLCMTAWSAAKLAPGQRAASPQVAVLMDTLQQAAVGKVSSMQPQQLSTLAWSYARLWNLEGSFLLHAIAKSAVKQLPRSGPQAVSNLAWAFARARHYDAAFTAALARRGKALLHEFSSGELSNLMWGLVTLGYQQGALFRAVAAHATQHCSRWDAKACIKLVDAFSRSGVPVRRFRALFYAVGDALAARPAAFSRITVHELVQLAVAYATVRVRHKDLLGQVLSAALQRLDDMSIADVVQFSWALAVLKQQHQTLLDTISARIATEMAKSSDPTQDTAASGSTHSGSVSGTPDAPGATSTNRWLIGGKLRVHHLPRLAWAFRTLKHDDAAWYMAAARHAEGMQQHPEQTQPSLQSNSTTAEANVPTQQWNAKDSGFGARFSVQQSQSRKPSMFSRHFRSKLATDIQVCNGSSGSIRMGPSTPQPVLVQRPDYRPSSSEASVGTALLLHSMQQQAGVRVQQ